ncbi:substrate-binding periplasmic protein [Colwelliaceae bacterium 6471]
MRYLVVLVILMCSHFAHSKTIKVAAIDWCPQICVDNEQKGYVLDLVEAVFKDSEYQLDIEYLPWSRAIQYVRIGKADALLSPAKAEAPELIFPTYQVGQQRMCFFTRQDSLWQYKGPESLKNMQIGIAADSSIEELNEYVRLNQNQFQFQPYHGRYIIQNAHKLDKKRMDAFLFTLNSTKYTLQQANEWSKYREAGCVSNANIYMAFTPAKHLQAETAQMIKFFDQRMASIDKTAFKDKLMASYGLTQ